MGYERRWWLALAIPKKLEVKVRGQQNKPMNNGSGDRLAVIFVDVWGGEIPFHRIYYFRRGSEVLWDRKHRLDRIFNDEVGDGHVRASPGSRKNYTPVN